MKTKKSSAKEIFRSLTLILVFMHTCLYHYKNFSQELFFPEDEKQPRLVMQVLFYILLMGGTFIALSGYTKPMINTMRIMKGTADVKQICISDIVYGFQLIIVDRIFAFFFCPVNGIIFKKLMKQEVASMYDLKMNLYLVDSLFCMGSCMILSSVIIYIFLVGVDRSKLRPRLNCLRVLFVVIATVVLYSTPTVRKWGFVRVNELIEDKKYITAMFINFLCGDYYPLFPYIAHYFYSVYGGISTAMKASKFPMHFFFCYGLVLFVYGLYLIKTHWRLGVYIGIYFEFSQRGMDYRSYLQWSQYGIMVSIFTGAVILKKDFGEIIYSDRSTTKGKSKKKKKKKKKKQSSSSSSQGWDWISLLELGNVGKIPLTIFVFESAIKAAIHLLMNDFLVPNFFPYLKDWDYSLSCVVVFGFFNVFLWIAIIKVWKRIHFAFSVDWILMKVVEIATGKKSSKFE